MEQRLELQKKRTFNVSMAQKYGMIAVFLLIIAIFSLLSPNFLTYSNIMNIMRQVSIVGLIAIGQTFVIISGGIDLSVGSIVAFTGILTAMILSGTESFILALLTCLAVGSLIGALNGLIISKLKLAPFIVTLATMTIFGGLTLLISGGNPIIISNETFKFIGQGYILGIPFPVILLVIMYVFFHFVIKNSIFGQYVYAIGGNEKAAELSGISITKNKIFIYALSGFLSALAALILTARLSAASPLAGSGYEMDVIAAVILGGASLSGGRGKITGTLLGVFILGVLTSGMNLLNISPFLQDVAKGLIILIAVTIDKLMEKK